MRVEKTKFDAILAKLLSTPPKPVTPKRKKARRKKTSAQ